MPCYSPPMHKDEHGEWQEGEIPQAKFDSLVRMLCAAMHLIEHEYSTYWPQYVRLGGAGIEKPSPKLAAEMQKWWTEHKAWDKKRKAKK